ncbi:MAG: endo alpha-1,4 polygalactosaminidase, partial [Anaerolineae bacterium]
VRQADASTPPMPTLPAATVTVFLPLILKATVIPKLPPIVSFQVQYTGELDISIDVDVFNLDLFDTPPVIIQALRKRGIFVMCYFSAGSYEDWRPDAHRFPAEVLGNPMEGWPGEQWLDIRRLDILGPIMEARLDLAVEKGCDGVDPDNVNGYENDTGFPLIGQDQLVYNRFLSTAAHRRGLAIGLKNDIEQAADLVSDFEWILNESCFSYGECDYLLPFKEAGKPVFVIEYDREPGEICPQAKRLGFNALIKHRELDAYRIDCSQFSTRP